MTRTGDLLFVDVKCGRQASEMVFGSGQDVSDGQASSEDETVFCVYVKELTQTKDGFMMSQSSRQEDSELERRKNLDCRLLDSGECYQQVPWNIDRQTDSTMSLMSTYILSKWLTWMWKTWCGPTTPAGESSTADQETQMSND